MSDNASCYTAKSLDELMGKNEISWRTVMAYAPIYYGRDELMVGTINKCLSKMSDGEETDWEENLEKVLFGYRRLPTSGGSSPSEHLYGSKTRMISLNLPWK